jgi:hypothetical protein
MFIHLLIFGSASDGLKSGFNFGPLKIVAHSRIMRFCTVLQHLHEGKFWLRALIIEK